MSFLASTPAPPTTLSLPKGEEIAPTNSLTFAEYMETERKSAVKHHFYFGRLIEMAGASYEHNLLSNNLLAALAAALKGAGCRTLGSDMKVFISEKVGYYPDVVVHCGMPLIAYGEALQNPLLVAEVLSSTTEAFDRGRKFKQYRTISTLRHILFLEQDYCFVEHYERDEAGTWRLRAEYDQMEQSLTLTIGERTIALPIADIYEFVEFPATEPETAA